MANDLKLQESHPVDSNLRPVKVGGEMTALELSKDKVRTKSLDAGDLTASSFTVKSLSVTEDLDVTGNIDSGSTITSAVNFIATQGSVKLLNDGQGIWFVDTNCKIYKESGSDQLNIEVGGAVMIKMHETAVGEWVELNNSALCQTQNEPTYNATDTYASFTNSNKLHLTFGAGNITDIHLIFPDGSCNCTLLITQDGTGSRTITNWKTFDQTGSGNESTVKWSGGTAPTLTTTANKTDIISFYWDNDNHRAYGVASLNF